MKSENHDARNRIYHYVNGMNLQETQQHRWFSEAELRHFQEEGVSSEMADFVVGFSRAYIDRRCLPFKILNKGVNENSTANIQQAIYGGEILAGLLSSEILRFEPWRYEKGNQHGDILTVNTPLEEGVAYSSFQDGNVIIRQGYKDVLTHHLDVLFGYECIGVGDKEYTIRTLWDVIFSKLNEGFEI
jgi:hypothetical protein